MPAAANTKLVKKDGSAPSDIEKKIAAKLVELEQTVKDSAALTFTGAKEIELDGNKKAILIFIPVPQIADYRKVQKTLTDEIEKTSGGATVLFIANRSLYKAKSWARDTKLNGIRPRSRSLKAVQEAILDDIVFPAEIVGKRTHVRQDGSKVLKVLLSGKEELHYETRTETYAGVYKKLTNKDVSFEATH